jgi:hypothetical protein
MVCGFGLPGRQTQGRLKPHPIEGPTSVCLGDSGRRLPHICPFMMAPICPGAGTWHGIMGAPAGAEGVVSNSHGDLIATDSQTRHRLILKSC